MPLNKFEQNALASRITEIINNEYGMTGPAQAASLGTFGGDSSAIKSEVSGFNILCEKLAHVTDLLGALLEKAMGEADAAMGQPHHGHEPDKPAADAPKRKPGRPAKTKPEAAPANGAATAATAAPAEDMFPTDGGVPSDGGEDDPLEAPPAEVLPPQPELTAPQAKETLRLYMQAFGTEGTAKLTALLVRVAGVKQFSNLAPDKYGAVVAAAQAEMAGRK